MVFLVGVVQLESGVLATKHRVTGSQAKLSLMLKVFYFVLAKVLISLGSLSANHPGRDGSVVGFVRTHTVLPICGFWMPHDP